MLFGACQEGRMDAPLSSDQELPQARTLPNTLPKSVRLLHTQRQIFGAKERDLLCVGWCPTPLFKKISLIIFILEFYFTLAVQGTNPFSLKLTWKSCYVETEAEEKNSKVLIPTQTKEGRYLSARTAERVPKSSQCQ